ncbi:hypothetical protein WN51_09270 [Melipona quadrifasciata]|uniref:Uncharacterized protein n=1 Tax=Melipona quadrifasciata TaxID=166423 RepID=A0A0M9A5F3_9HYME|nr:hypothetical protein WN51_09270 [Melipona quadrifasciata]
MAKNRYLPMKSGSIYYCDLRKEQQLPPEATAQRFGEVFVVKLAKSPDLNVVENCWGNLEDSLKRPRIPQIRVSNTRLAQAASGCAPSVDVLPIFDVKQQSVRNPARMGANQPSRFSYNNKRLG